MTRRKNLATLEPLFFGRLTRVLAGVLTLYWAWQLWGPSTGGQLATIGLGFLGVSFLVGGLMGNPGCELTALPNLLVAPEKRHYTL